MVCFVRTIVVEVFDVFGVEGWLFLFEIRYRQIYAQLFPDFRNPRRLFFPSFWNSALLNK